MIKELSRLEVITLFVEELPRTRTFYRDVFGLEVVYEDESSSVLKLENLLINLLLISRAPRLVEPAAVGGPAAGPRLLLTIKVDDADAICAQLARHGVPLLNGPVDRPWGRRTASFADPAGNIWEVAQDLHAR
ncbi:MAG TPA: VOC family protein [Polyangiaceae bacterium]|jgi:catechol 2,3-dioxygenase-like lactoylglutathione lyase family enzyme|nr:VOC family protein [Polyangiaceae bacterium]